MPQEDWPAVAPKAKVHSDDKELFLTCQAAYERGMFAAVNEKDIFRGQHGKLVLNGAMGVDKTKVVDGKTRHLLRFICNLTPLNAFMRKIEGDCKTLPQSVFLGRIVLSSQEYLVFDGEDLQSSFN